MTQLVPQDDVIDALARLEDPGARVALASFPRVRADVERPGLYAWFTDAPGAEQLSRGLGRSIAPGLIYAGQAGAGTSTATLWSRIATNHRAGTIRGSTFRRTLAAVLARELDLGIGGGERLGGDGESRLSAWLREHLDVAVAPYDKRARLGHLEDLVLARLDPPLNLEGRPATPIRRELSRLRALLGAQQRVGPPMAPHPSMIEVPPRPLPTRTPGEHAPDMAAFLAGLVGATIPTLTGRPNRIVALRGGFVEVATDRSPAGRAVPIVEIQDAADRLYADGELVIDVASVGYRSAFVGAVLSALPGVAGTARPRRVRLIDRADATDRPG